MGMNEVDGASHLWIERQFLKRKKASGEDKYCNLWEAKDTDLQWVSRANLNPLVKSSAPSNTVYIVLGYRNFKPVKIQSGQASSERHIISHFESFKDKPTLAALLWNFVISSLND